jgi:hypothetical protein
MYHSPDSSIESRSSRRFCCLTKTAGGGAPVDGIAWEVGGKARYSRLVQIPSEESHDVMLGGDEAADFKRTRGNHEAALSCLEETGLSRTRSSL